MAGAIIQTDVLIKPKGQEKWSKNVFLKVLSFENSTLTLYFEWMERK